MGQSQNYLDDKKNEEVNKSNHKNYSILGQHATTKNLNNSNLHTPHSSNFTVYSGERIGISSWFVSLFLQKRILLSGHFNGSEILQWQYVRRGV